MPQVPAKLSDHIDVFEIFTSRRQFDEDWKHMVASFRTAKGTKHFWHLQREVAKNYFVPVWVIQQKCEHL